MQWVEDEFKTVLQISDVSSPPDEKQEVLKNIHADDPLASLCIEEQKALYRAFGENDTLKSKRHIADFINLRDQKTVLMREEDTEIENLMELVEGTAKYIEFKLSGLLNFDYQSIEAIRIHPRFNFYHDIIVNRYMFIEMANQGELASERYYTTGLIMCLLLDRFSGADWKRDLFRNYHKKKTGLYKLLNEQIFTQS